MEEENLVKRIGDAYLNPNFVDGQVLLHTDMNEIVSVTKTAINENYNDIQRLQNGTISAGNANTVDSASVSRFADGELPDDDNKIPTAQQVKSFINSIDIGQSFELLEQIQEELVDARGGKTTLDARLDEIDSDINTINTNIEEISTDVETNKTDIATNKSGIAANASAIERLNTELNNTNETVSGISTALETTNTNLDTTNTNLDNLTKSVSDLDAEVDGKQNTLTAGKNITIDGNEISATGGTGTWIGEDEPPADENYNMWVDPTEPLNNVGSEVVNSLSGNETDKAPSVRAVNGTILYENENGSNEDITLSDNAKNYSKLVIEYKSNNAVYSSVEISKPNLRRVQLMGDGETLETHIMLLDYVAQIIETRVTWLKKVFITFTANQDIEVSQETDYYNLKITKVTGYK